MELSYPLKKKKEVRAFLFPMVLVKSDKIQIYRQTDLEPMKNLKHQIQWLWT